jgi:hypothetical protein
MRKAYKILIGKPKGKRLLGRPRRKWENNIKMVLKELRCNVVDWIHRAQDREQWRALVNRMIGFRVQ